MSTEPPPYVVHEVDEGDVTVDWYFGPGHVRATVVQTLLLLVGWFFAVLPVVITGSALIHRDDPERGWWGYQEGFDLWDSTMEFLGVLLVLFVVGFGVLALLQRRALRRTRDETTYDAERLAARLELAERWYGAKYGPDELRLAQRSVRIEPYGTLETYALRNLYREQGLE